MRRFFPWGKEVGVPDLNQRESQAPFNRALSPSDGNSATGRRSEQSVSVEGLSLWYDGRPAFEQVSLSAPIGQMIALMGPSGCGKSSFLSCLNRLVDLIPGCRVSGRIVYDGSDLLSPGIDLIALRRRIGMIFQRPNPFPLSIRKNLELPLKEHGVRDRREREAIVEGALRDVGLWEEVKDRLWVSALTLSGGQQQRLCIARALALRPEVLLFDEPCSALDPLSSAVVEDLIAGLRGRYTVFIATHNLAQARRLADAVGLFWVREGAGRLIEFGPTDQLFDSPKEAITAAYIRGARG